MVSGVTYINPVAECLTPPQFYDLSLDLSQPATVGLVINKIVDCDVFMHMLGDELVELRSRIKLNIYNTGTITHAPTALLDEVAAECSAAICAIGHCGSCTAGTVKDSVALIERGCPSVAMVTEVFWDQAAMLARSLGWPGAPRVQLPYPIWGANPQTMRSVAETAAKAAVLRLELPDDQTA